MIQENKKQNPAIDDTDEANFRYGIYNAEELIKNILCDCAKQAVDVFRNEINNHSYYKKFSKEKIEEYIKRFEETLNAIKNTVFAQFHEQTERLVPVSVTDYIKEDPLWQGIGMTMGFAIPYFSNVHRRIAFHNQALRCVVETYFTQVVESLQQITGEHEDDSETKSRTVKDL